MKKGHIGDVRWCDGQADGRACYHRWLGITAAQDEVPLLQKLFYPLCMFSGVNGILILLVDFSGNLAGVLMTLQVKWGGCGGMGDDFKEILEVGGGLFGKLLLSLPSVVGIVDTYDIFELVIILI